MNKTKKKRKEKRVFTMKGIGGIMRVIIDVMCGDVGDSLARTDMFVL